MGHPWNCSPNKRRLATLAMFDARWCPIVSVQLVYKYYFTRVYGGYIYSYWDYKPTNITGGAPPCGYVDTSRSYPMENFHIYPISIRWNSVKIHQTSWTTATSLDSITKTHWLSQIPSGDQHGFEPSELWNTTRWTNLPSLLVNWPAFFDHFSPNVVAGQ